VRDYEARIDVSEAMVLVAMGGNMLRRTTHPSVSKRTLSVLQRSRSLRTTSPVWMMGSTSKA